MLEWYFKSMLVWTIILASCIFCLWAYNIVRLDDYPKERRLPVLFIAAVVIAAVPGLRFLFAVGACIVTLQEMFSKSQRGDK